MYSIVDFKKYGVLFSVFNNKAEAKDVPNYDVDKLRSPDVPILVLNLTTEIQGARTMYSGFAHCKVNNSGANVWVLDDIELTEKSPTEISVTKVTTA